MASEMRVRLPVLGERTVREDPNEPGHYLWMNAFGWSDCSPKEDAIIRKVRDAKETQEKA